MATVKQRIIAASGAIVFFISTIALTVAVIVSAIQEKNQDDSKATATQQPAEGKLQGTKLSGFTPVASVSELQTTDLEPGSGKEVTSVDQPLTVDYTGALAKDGTIFQSSLDSGQQFTTPLSGVIEGWQKGVIGMKEGGKRRIVIPAAQAYGAQEQSGIPANSDLVFDITLHKIGE
ncbi:MAG: putative peptidyl-prolyl cis-trans isomerase [Candidatus Saccharibacteria bacterium]|nr:putative peptidyl-prolyl cis-trans isomerase [Candidatus Saccharibacteria bacterium]